VFLPDKVQTMPKRSLIVPHEQYVFLMQKLCKFNLFEILSMISKSYVYHAEIARRKLGVPMPTEGKTNTNLEH
jgi:hypothetical protein